MTSRIARGFHRIGVVLAVPLLLLAVGVAGHEAWLQWTTKDPYAAFADAPPPSTGKKNPYDNPEMSIPVPPSKPHPYYQADYTSAGLAFALALALYTAARAVGWVLDGFMGPARR